MLLDSSVLIAILNPEDKHHEIAVDSFSDSHRYQFSALSITEVLPAAFKAGTSQAVMGKLLQIATEIIALDSKIAELAASIRVSQGLKTPDAIISASATQTKAQLWTLDAKLAKAHKGARLLA